MASSVHSFIPVMNNFKQITVINSKTVFVAEKIITAKSCSMKPSCSYPLLF